MIDQAEKRRAGKSALSARSLSRHFKASGGRDVFAIKDISLEVEPGEFLAIVGPSGCGKTTLLRILAGLEAPSSGSVLVEGREVVGPTPGVVGLFQQYAQTLLPWRTVLGNVAFAIEHLGALTRSEIKERCRMHLQLVGLSDFETHYPRQLSGGMQQRVALARALVANPKIILMDEPFSSLDALSRLDLQQLILRLWEERQFTAIMVTHDVDEAAYLSERVIVLSDRPAVVAGTVMSGLPRGRDPITTREDERFLNARKRLLAALIARDFTGLSQET